MKKDERGKLRKKIIEVRRPSFAKAMEGKARLRQDCGEAKEERGRQLPDQILGDDRHLKVVNLIGFVSG